MSSSSDSSNSTNSPNTSVATSSAATETSSEEKELISALVKYALIAGKQAIREKPKATADEIRRDVKSAVIAKVGDFMDKLVGQITIKESSAVSESPTIAVTTPESGWCVVM